MKIIFFKEKKRGGAFNKIEILGKCGNVGSLCWFQLRGANWNLRYVTLCCIMLLLYTCYLGADSTVFKVSVSSQEGEEGSFSKV